MIYGIKIDTDVNEVDFPAQKIQHYYVMRCKDSHIFSFKMSLFTLKSALHYRLRDSG